MDFVGQLPFLTGMAAVQHAQWGDMGAQWCLEYQPTSLLYASSHPSLP